MSYLFTPSNATTPGTAVIKFYYLHAGRAEASLEVDTQLMRARYISPVGTEGPWDGNAAERNSFGTIDQGAGRHGILLSDFHSLFGRPQTVAFHQILPTVWRGRHSRHSDTIHIMLMPQQLAHQHLALPASATPQVIELPDGHLEQDLLWF